MLRKLMAFLLIVPILLFAVPTTPVFGAVAATDESILGVSRWSVQTGGDLVPGADSSYDIGESGAEVADIFADQITLGGVSKTSWGSVVTPWEEVGTALYPTSAPYKMIFNTSTGILYATGVSVDSGNYLFNENGAIIENGTNNEIQFTENSDNLTMVFDGTNVEIETDDGGGHLIFDINEADASDGSVQFRTSNDDDDYVRIWTSSNVPIIESIGDCNLTLKASSGVIDMDNDTVYITTASLCTVNVCGTSTYLNQDTLVNSTDDTFEFKSNDSNTIVRSEGYDDKDGILELSADSGDDTADTFQIASRASTNDLVVMTTNGTITAATCSTAAAWTFGGDCAVVGTTPRLTVGDGGEEDPMILFDGADTDWTIGYDDTAGQQSIGFGTGTTVGTSQFFQFATPGIVTIGNAQEQDLKVVLDGNAFDFYVGLDDSADALSIGTGSTVGTNDIITIGADMKVTYGDATERDIVHVYDGNAQDFYVGLDDSADELVMGTGSTVGTNALIRLGADRTVKFGDGGSEDIIHVYDGNLQDWYTAIDDSTDTFIIGTGSTVGLGPAITVATDSDVTIGSDLTVLGRVAATSTTTRSLHFDIGDFMIVAPLTGAAALEVTTTTAPGIALNNELPSIVWTNTEATPVSVTFRVPDNYLAGGAFRSTMDHSVATSPTVDYRVLINDSGTAWDTTATNQTAAALGSAGSPSTVAMSVTTDFGSIQAASLVTVEVWPGLANSAIGDLELYFLDFVYTGKI